MNRFCSLGQASRQEVMERFHEIAGALANGLRIMIYCRAGKNRSPIPCAMVVAPLVGGLVPAMQWICSLRRLCFT